MLRGGSGNDTYIFNQGDGQDIIVDNEGINTLVFKDLKLTDARFKREGDHLLIQGTGGDQVKITSYFYQDTWKPRKFQFVDCSVNASEITTLASMPVQKSLATFSNSAESTISVEQQTHSLINAMASFVSDSGSSGGIISAQEPQKILLVSSAA